MVKYDYAKLLSAFNPRQYKMFVTLSTNEEYVTEQVYDAIKHNISGCSRMFLGTGDKFRHWLCFYSPKSQFFSYFDTELIAHITRDKTWADDFNGYIADVQAVTRYLIASWCNMTKSRKVNMNVLHQIYLRYIRFLNTDAGQNFAYASSLDSFNESDCNGFYCEDIPYWESSLYKEQQLLKFKKTVLLSECKSTLENVEMQVIWNMTFNGTGKFSYKEAERLVNQELGTDKISSSNLYRNIKRLRLVMLQKIYESLDSKFGFFSDVSFEVDGVVTTFKKLIEKCLFDAKVDVAMSKEDEALTNTKIVEFAKSWADKHGMISSTYTGNPDILLKVKGDITGALHKGWKMYFYKGGGYRDFYSGKTGFFKELG